MEVMLLSVLFDARCERGSGQFLSTVRGEQVRELR